MYDDLVKRLRNCASKECSCNNCNLIVDDSCTDTLMKLSADAIEKLNEALEYTERQYDLAEDWPRMLHDGFAECMRVLRGGGVLIFKWSEYNIPADEVWNAIGQKPLFGHHSGKKSNTFWGAFMKGVPWDMEGGNDN